MTQTAEQERVDFELMRAEFEKIFGAMPHSCTWTGRGYCPTRFGAWDAQDFDQKFTGFVAAWQAARRAQEVPDGWVLVPIEPTEKMVNEGSCAQTFQHGHRYIGEYAAKAAWRSMLAAAPRPPEEASTTKHKGESDGE